MPALPPGSLMDALKEAVRDRHARLETLPFVAALTARDLPLAGYVSQLRAMAAIHSVLDLELEVLASPELDGIRQGRPSRLEHLRRDLAAFDLAAFPDHGPVVAATQGFCGLIRDCRREHPRDLIAVIYVLEGTTLGNAVHLPDVLAAFGGAGHYYAGYGPATGEHWLRLREALNGLDLDEAGRQGVIRTAHQCFDRFEVLYQALHPLAEADRCHVARTLNPEAGDHPVPGDPREIQAALAAARRCRAAFPYLEHRYGVRGRNFAQSDAAWLASLAGLPEPVILEQVAWLGGVLASRGMPRLILERQLDWLHEALRERCPERVPDYEGLRAAAGAMAGSRLGRFAPGAWEAHEAAFRVATGDELAGAWRNTGSLILSALADAAAGLEPGPAPVVDWLTDPDRFPAPWISAVLGLQARAQAGGL